MTPLQTILTTSALCVFLSSALANEQLPMSQFSKQNLDGWNEKEFKNLTVYSFVKEGDTTVLQAHTKNSASGLFKEQTIDLVEYPYLNWSWKTTTQLNVGDEKTKQGDDYSARIYIIKDGGFFFWNTKALNYVWAKHEAIESVWPNAFAPDNAMMIAIRSKNDPQNVWFKEKRDLAKDFKLAFGEDINEIDGIAIMADTDNSHDETVSYFGELYFSKQ